MNSENPRSRFCFPFIRPWVRVPSAACREPARRAGLGFRHSGRWWHAGFRLGCYSIVLKKDSEDEESDPRDGDQSARAEQPAPAGENRDACEHDSDLQRHGRQLEDEALITRMIPGGVVALELPGEPAIDRRELALDLRLTCLRLDQVCLLRRAAGAD